MDGEAQTGHPLSLAPKLSLAQSAQSGGACARSTQEEATAVQGK